VARVLTLLVCSIAALMPGLAHAQATTIDFHQFGGPSVFNAETPPLMVAGAAISGGEVLSQANFLAADMGNVYGTASFCNGFLDTITINFSQPVSNFSVLVLNGETVPVTYTVMDDKGDLVPVTLDTIANGGAQVVTLPANNIMQVTIGEQQPDPNDFDFFIGTVTFTTGLSILDPDPTLLKGSGITTDPNVLATGGTPVVGVSADGVTPLVIRIPAVAAMDNLTITIINDKGQPSSSAQQDGMLAAVGGTPSPSPLVVQAVTTTAGPMGFAVYLPPIDFDRAGLDDAAANRSISIQVSESPPGTSPPGTSPPVTGPTSGVAVKLVRPPVVLVHGVWANATTTWSGFSTLQNDPRFFVQLVRYDQPLGAAITASTPAYDPAVLMAQARRNSLGFAFNAPSVMTQVQQFILQYRTNANVAVESADLVTHSMGGVIARTIENLPGFMNSSGIPLFHKLITIDTPHLGTPLAAQLLLTNNDCVRTQLANAGLFAFTTVTLMGNSNLVSGAVNDFLGDGTGVGLSAALASIQTPNGHPVPTALVAGTMNAGNLNGLNCTACAAALLRTRCGANPFTGSPADPLAANLTAAGWPTVFGGAASDAIVPLTSQIANTTPNSGTMFQGVVHSAGVLDLSFNGPDVLDFASVPPVVIALLNESVTNADFHPLP